MGGFGVTTAHPPPPHPPQPPPPLGGAVIVIEFTQGVGAEEKLHEVTTSVAVLVPTEV